MRNIHISLLLALFLTPKYTQAQTSDPDGGATHPLIAASTTTPTCPSLTKEFYNATKKENQTSLASIKCNINKKSAPLLSPPATAAPIQIVSLATPQFSTSQPAEAGKLESVIISFAWPATILGIFLLLMASHRLQTLFSTVFGRMRKLKGGPLEIEFSPDGAQELRASINDQLHDYICAAKSEYDRQARAHDLNQMLALAVTKIKDHLSAFHSKTTNLRATVHVPDIVFEGFLYQLLDYQPKLKTGRGRRLSERYGLIGRAWRMNQSLFTCTALGKQDSPESTIKELLKVWGLNTKEAEDIAQGARQSCLCIILRVNKRPVGLLYLDDTTKDIFKDLGNPQNDSCATPVNEDIEKFEEIEELAAAVEMAVSTLRGKGTYLEF